MDNSPPLELQRSMITLESRNPLSTAKAVVGRLPRFMGDVAVKIQGLAGKVSNVVGLTSQPREVKELLGDFHYGQVKPLGVFIPPGLSVPYLTYLDALEGAQAALEGTLDDVLNPFNKWLGLCLTQPETLASVRGGKSIPGVRLPELSVVKKGMAGCFQKNSQVSTSTFGKVAARIEDYHETLRRAERLKERHGKITPSQLKLASDETVVRLEQLREAIQLEPETYQVSGKSLELLTNTSYGIAEHLEFYAAYSFELSVFLTALNETSERLRNTLTR